MVPVEPELLLVVLLLPQAAATSAPTPTRTHNLWNDLGPEDPWAGPPWTEESDVMTPSYVTPPAPVDGA